MEYPDHHPRAKEIEELKRDIEAKYEVVKFNEEAARSFFKEAMESLKKMGEAHKGIHKTFKEMAEKLKELKAIIDSPTI